MNSPFVSSVTGTLTLMNPRIDSRYIEWTVPPPIPAYHEHSLLAFLIVAHLVGDFLLQNHWMQTKSKSSFVCTVHVAFYSSLFWLLLPWNFVLLILAEHWLQDRFGLHLKWMALYRQTTPDKWPVGPLCMDQSFHLAFIAAVVFFGGLQ